MNDEDHVIEDANALIEVIWPMLDEGWSKEQILGMVYNALDAWEPKP